MRDSLKPKKESFLELMDYVAEAIAELQAHELKIQEVAARRLEQEAGGAAVDSSPEGVRLMNYITANEKGCDAALRRLESGRKPDRSGPKRGPKKPEAAPAATERKPEFPPEPAAVAADVQDTVAVAVPADDAAPRPTIDPTETMRDDVPGLLTAEPGDNLSTYEAIEDPTPVGRLDDLSTYEAIEDPAPVGRVDDLSTYEAIEDPAPVGRVADLSTLEAMLDDLGDEAELEPDSPEFARLRELCRQIEATYCAGRGLEDKPAPGTHPDLARSDTPLSRAEEQFNLRQRELSRQLDAHFGINGERPEPVGEDSVSDRAGGSDRPEWGDSS